jgi:ABC-type transport system involved in multi-copper enzyme maturation permease subunit
MDLIAARPVTRTTQVIGAYVAVIGGLAVLTAAACAGTAIGLRVRPIGVAPLTFASTAAMAWLLFATWAAIGLVVSALRRESGSAIAWMSGIIAGAFVFEYLSRLWHPLSRLHPLSLFAYYRPQVVAAGGAVMQDVTVLAAVLVAAFALALVVFRRRDL